LKSLKDIDAQVAEGLDIRTFIGLHNKTEALQIDQVRRPDPSFGQTLLPQGPAIDDPIDSRD
jgi:hypothetical protein